MTITGTITLDENTIKALVTSCLDSSQKSEIMGQIWKIAEAHGYCQNDGSPTEKANS